MGEPNGDPILRRASVTFHTNDENKDHDTRVRVDVVLDIGTADEPATEIVAYIDDQFGEFREHSDAGPFTFLMQNPVGLNEMRSATVDLTIHPVTSILGLGDTWRFNFLVDLFFSDGSHLLSRGSNIELSSQNLRQLFVVE